MAQASKDCQAPPENFGLAFAIDFMWNKIFWLKPGRNTAAGSIYPTFQYDSLENGVGDSSALLRIGQILNTLLAILVLRIFCNLYFKRVIIPSNKNHLLRKWKLQPY